MTNDLSKSEVATRSRVLAGTGSLLGWGLLLLGAMAWWVLMQGVWNGYEGRLARGLVTLWTSLFVILQSLGVSCTLLAVGWKRPVGRIVTIASLLMFVVLVVGILVGAQRD